MRRLSRITGPSFSSPSLGRTSRCITLRLVVVHDLGVDHFVVLRLAALRAAVGPGSSAPAWAPSGFCAYMAAPIFWLTCASFSALPLMASTSVPSRAFFTSATASLTSVLSSSGTFSSFSRRNFSVEYARVSAWLRTSASSLRPAVLLGVVLGVAHHLLDVLLGQRAAARDDHRLLATGALVLRADVHDAVRVDVEGDLDLRDAARRGGRPVSWKVPSFLLYAAISRSPW